MTVLVLLLHVHVEAGTVVMRVNVACKDGDGPNHVNVVLDRGRERLFGVRELVKLRPPHPQSPAEPSSDPHYRPYPSTGTVARNNRAVTDKAPWSAEETGRSSATGATRLSTE